MWSEFDFTREGGGRRTTRERNQRCRRKCPLFPSEANAPKINVKLTKPTTQALLCTLIILGNFSPVVLFAIQQEKIVTLCFCAFQATCTNIQGVRGSVETSCPWLPLCFSHALFTPPHPTQADDNDDDEGLEMKWLVLVCAVVMLLRTVSGKCNSPSSACQVAVVMIRIER